MSDLELTQDQLIPLSVHLLIDSHCSPPALLFYLRGKVVDKDIKTSETTVEYKAPRVLLVTSFDCFTFIMQHHAGVSSSSMGLLE